MKDTTVGLIVDHADYDYELETYEGYSGRGAFGKTTTGIQAPSDREFIAGVMSAVETLIDQEDYQEAKEICSELKNVRFDSLGRQIIAY